jgi:hypothetical protein
MTSVLNGSTSGKGMGAVQHLLTNYVVVTSLMSTGIRLLAFGGCLSFTGAFEQRVMASLPVG